jgi:chromosome segregation ATPase
MRRDTMSSEAWGEMQRIKELEDERTELSRQLVEGLRNMEAVAEIRDEYRRERDELREELDASQEDRSKLHARAGDLASELQDVIRERDELRRELDEQAEEEQRRFEEMRAEIRMLEGELANAMDHAEELVEALGNMTADRDYWVKEAAKAKDEADYMSTEWGKLFSERNELQDARDREQDRLRREAGEHQRIYQQFTAHMRTMRRIHGVHEASPDCWCNPTREDFRR